LAGANPIGSTAFGALRGLAQGVALTPANLAANFPMATAAPSYALGFAISSSYAVLDAQVLASERTNEVRIISSPKVTTMDGSKAVIKQGEDVPVVTPATSTGPATVTFKEAVLKLEVKPTITMEGKISMEVKANNDFPNYARAAELQGNPPINKSEVESKVVINDGETLVIGGILRAQTDKGQAGLPWISKVPILGWLFKYEDTTKIRKQLLIFVTPRIVQDEKSTTGTDTKGSAEKPKG
jgi:type IV pilus assembly protein PilQ